MFMKKKSFNAEGQNMWHLTVALKKRNFPAEVSYSSLFNFSLMDFIQMQFLLQSVILLL